MPLATHWSAWWRYSVLGRRKSGIGATIWGAWFPKRHKNAKNNVFFDFRVFNGQKMTKKYQESFFSPVLYLYRALEESQWHFSSAQLPQIIENRWF